MPNITGSSSSYKGVFALDIITSGLALILLGLASAPLFKRLIKDRRFSYPNKTHGSSSTPLKSTLATYLFLWPALLFLFLAYGIQFVYDVHETNGTILYNGNLQFEGRRPFLMPLSEHGKRLAASALSFTKEICAIIFTVLLNGAVWIHAAHVKNNGTGLGTPQLKSKLWNAFIMLCILGTGIAAWGLGLDARTMGSNSLLTFSDTVRNDEVTKILYVFYQCVVIAASVSASVGVIRSYITTERNAYGSPERPHLARFTVIVVPLIWLRDAFIILNIVLIFVGSSDWSTSSRLACLYLLIIFGQLTNLAILATVAWGTWSMGQTGRIFGAGHV